MEKDREMTENKSNINLAQMVLFFWGERKTLVRITAIFVVIGLIYALLSTPWYSAKVKIMPMTGNENQLLNQYSNLAALAGINIGAGNGDNYSLYPEIIKSNFILDRVLKHKFYIRKYGKKMTLFEFWDTEMDTSDATKWHKTVEDAKAKLREDYIKPSIDKITNMLTIKVSVPKDPGLAAELANFITDQLDIYNKYYRHYKAKDQRKFIEKSLKETSANLKRAEDNLKKFLNKNKDLTSPETKLIYEKLNNELNLQRTLYLELKKNLELAKIAEVKETETLNILERAVVPVRRFKPKRLIILIVFTIIGVIFSILYVLGKQFYLSLAIAIKKFRENP